MYAVSFGDGDSHYVEACGHEAFEVSQGGFKLEYGVFSIPRPGMIPFGSAPDFIPATIPAEGATLSGNFDGYGKRKIKDESANKTYTVDLIYHNYDTALTSIESAARHAVMARMRKLGCFR